MFLSAPWNEVLMDVVNTFVHSTVCKKKGKADSEQCLMSFLLSHSNRIEGLYATVSTPQQNKQWWTCIYSLTVLQKNLEKCIL